LKQISKYCIFLLLASCANVSLGQNQFGLNVSYENDNFTKKKPGFKRNFSNPAQRNKAINDLYSELHAQGYLGAEAIIEKTDSNTIFIRFYPGSTYKWAKLRTGNIDQEIISKNAYRDKFKYGERFSISAFVNVGKNILNEYENQGYPFASIRLDSVIISNNFIEASLLVNKGNQITIDSIIIEGKSKINRHFIYNYLNIKPGDLYNESAVSKISKRLKELPFLTEEKPPVIEFSPDKAKIKLQLNHRNASSFSGIIGFMPNNSQSGKLLITGDVQLKLNSALGYGEQLDLNWRRLQVQTQSLNVYARYPYLFNTKLGIDGNFDFYTKDSTFQSIGLGLGLQYLFIGTDFIKLFYKRFNSKILDRNQYVNATALPPFADVAINNLGIQYYSEKLDYRLNPLKGFLISVSGMAGSKQIKKIPEIPESLYNKLNLNTLQISAQLQADCYIKLQKRSTLKLGSNLAYINNQSLFISDLMRIGGLKTLRGFDEESIFSSGYAIGTIEARYHIEKNSFVCAFLNGGFTEQNLYTDYNNTWLYGFGAGLNIFTKAGILSINYALGSQNGRPIEFKAAKIHLGYVGLF
jgi:outer membrane protein assembly factor BamA